MTTPQNLAGTYQLDPAHSEIGFTARHAMVTKVRGNFTDYTTNLVAGENLNDSTVEVTIKADSITTGVDQRDDHLRSADFFDVENHPEITFRGTEFNLDDAGNGTVTGDLTIKGITRSVELDVNTFGAAVDPDGNTRLGFEAETSIDRQEFNVDWQAPLKTGGVMVSNKIKINIEGSAIKQ